MGLKINFRIRGLSESWEDTRITNSKYSVIYPLSHFPQTSLLQPPPPRLHSNFGRVANIAIGFLLQRVRGGEETMGGSNQNI